MTHHHLQPPLERFEPTPGLHPLGIVCQQTLVDAAYVCPQAAYFLELLVMGEQPPINAADVGPQAADFLELLVMGEQSLINAADVCLQAAYALELLVMGEQTLINPTDFRACGVQFSEMLIVDQQALINALRMAIQIGDPLLQMRDIRRQPAQNRADKSAGEMARNIACTGGNGVFRRHIGGFGAHFTYTSMTAPVVTWHWRSYFKQ